MARRKSEPKGPTGVDNPEQPDVNGVNLPAAPPTSKQEDVVLYAPTRIAELSLLPDLPDPKPVKPRRRQGSFIHKPECSCAPCKARRGEPEAIAIPAGDGGTPLDSTPPVSKENPLLSTGLTPFHYVEPTSARARVAEWIRVRTLEPNIQTAEIAKRMGIAPVTLYGVLKKARRAGWLVFDDPLAQLEYEVIPQTVDNLNYWLKKKDKTVTIETAKGTIFKQFQAAQGIQENTQQILALKIELPEGEGMKVISGQIVGKPKQLEE